MMIQDHHLSFPPFISQSFTAMSVVDLLGENGVAFRNQLLNLELSSSLPCCSVAALVALRPSMQSATRYSE